MDLEIYAIADKNDLQNERVAINVLKECNLKFFLLFKTHFTEKGFYHESDKSYWFTPRKVSAGDTIIIYTKSGTEKIKKDEKNETTTHFIYWGLKSPIFTDDSKGVVLAQVSDWMLSNKI